MSDPYKVAEAAIGKILADLEAKTGVWVERVDVESVDVTRIRDDRPRLMRTARIVSKARPGSDWVGIGDPA